MKRLFSPILLSLSLLVLPVIGQAAPKSPTDVIDTTTNYVEQFYPLWFTYWQTRFAEPNHLVGPDNISPIYHFVVAINDDTLYVSAFLDLSVQPLVVTIPSTTAKYSVLVLDPYGDIFKSAIPPQTAGKYALYGPSFKGMIPAELTPVPLPTDYMTFIVRADRFLSGADVTSEADRFRRAFSSQPLCAYLGQTCPEVPMGGPAQILPEAVLHSQLRRLPTH